LRQVLGERLELPGDAALEDLERHALDLGQVRIVSSRSCGRHGAIVKPQLPITAVVTPRLGEGRTLRIPGELCVEVRVAVDDSGHQREVAGVDHLTRISPERRTDRADVPVADARSARDGAAPLPSLKRGAANQQVIHASGASAFVAFDRSDIAHRGVSVVAAELAFGTPLSQQVPALVEFLAHMLQARRLFCRLGVGAQLMLFIDQSLMC